MLYKKSICSNNAEETMRKSISVLLGSAVLLALAAPSLAQTTLTIGTVNNGDMIRMQGLTSEFTAKNPDITVNG